MKKIILALSGIVAILFTSQAYAYDSPGFVLVADNYMVGTMHVRYNTSYPNAYIYGSGAVGDTVTFSGTDGSGNYFSCYVPTSSALYAGAVNVKNNLKNGSYLYLIKGTSSTECTYVFMGSASHYQE